MSNRINAIFLHQTIGRFLALAFVCTALPCFFGSGLQAQTPTRLDQTYYLYNYEMAPGEIAQRKLLARQSMVGYFQPVRLQGPEGAQIDVFSEGNFHATSQEMTTAGMMVGHVYRMKVTNIPGHPGVEVYPSVEIVGRLFPPQGREVDFPIPVNLHLDDIEPALNGALVTRVIYLENPRAAIAEQRSRFDQPFIDVGVTEDPVRVAEKMGRPMVILRIGSRVPDSHELNAFGFGTPPLKWFESASIRQFRSESPGQMDPFNSLINESATNSGNDSEIIRDGAVRQVAYQEPTPARTVPARSAASAAQTGQQSWSLGDSNSVPAATVASRQEFEQCLPGQQHQVLDNAYFSNAAPMFNTQPWPDELLIDGGDRDRKVTVKDKGDQWEVHGLESEDTIAHFDTLDGRRIVDASNRVAIYAPRFLAVRKVDYLGRTKYANEINHLDEKVSPVSNGGMDISSTTLQNLQPIRHKRLTQPTGLDNKTRSVRIENGIQIRAFKGSLKTFENLRLVRTGYLDNREKGRLSIAIQRAMSWETNLSAQSTTQNLHVTVADGVASAREAIHVKTEFDRPQIRLVKLASTNTAHPGDEVEFTIRFDNVGGQVIGNVTILDNLTGRLDYIADSSTCTLPGKFIMEPNKAGSHTLRWEIDEPLNVGKGGVIRFKCRVR